jgi:hypothetical protein
MSFEITVPRRRTCDKSVAIFEADGSTPIVLEATDAVRFKMYRRDQGIPVLEVDSGSATANGSRITVEDLDPARVTLRIAEGDTADLNPGTYDAEIAVVDDSETSPADATKLADSGVVHLLATGGGTLGFAP